MSRNVMVLAEHTGAQISEGTHELIAKSREVAGELGGITEVVLLGAPELASQLLGADIVVVVEHPALSAYVPEAYERALCALVKERAPRLLLMANGTVGLDLGAALSLEWQAPLCVYASGLEVENGSILATSQILGGKLFAEIELPGERAIVTVLGGAFASLENRAETVTKVVSFAPPLGLETLRMSLRAVNETPADDVDITAAEMLVSVGRGIESEDNLEVVLELATSLEVPLSASRPIIDAGWLPKTRQVGQSGAKVKPRVYLAFGISGAPEHLEGMRDAELIIACNTDADAPIFNVADYGTCVDLFDLVPEIVDRVRG